MAPPHALDYALTGEPSALKPGRARYTMMCAENGGILDDLIVYRLGDAEFLVVANAANAAVVGAALTERCAGRDTRVTDRTDDYALIAIQGPRARCHPGVRSPTPTWPRSGTTRATPRKSPGSTSSWLAPATQARTASRSSRRLADAEHLWSELTQAGSEHGLIPAGLAARDSLRLEAGMPLYGNELSADLTPFDAGLGRVVKLDKPGDFVGRTALAERASAAPQRQLVGLTSQSRRVPRHGYDVLWEGEPSGTVTSGAPSPTLGVPIAMAYVRPEVAVAASSSRTGTGTAALAVDIRGRAEPATLVELPFYRRPA